MHPALYSYCNEVAASQLLKHVGCTVLWHQQLKVDENPADVLTAMLQSSSGQTRLEHHG